MSSPSLSRQSLFDTLRRSAARHPERLAIRQGDEDWSYREFEQMCLRVAGGLRELGLQPGDRVAVLSRNSNAFALARYAIAAAGAVLVPVNFMLTASEAAYIIGHSGARLLLVGDTEVSKAEQAAADCPHLEQLIWLPLAAQAPAAWPTLAELAQSSALAEMPDLPAGTTAQIIYTSGTESAPKGAVLSHSAVLWQYASILCDAEVAEGDTLLHAMPLFHCAQLDCFLGPSLQVGGSNIITSDNSPETLLKLLKSESITSFFAPPTVWIALLNSPAFDSSALSQLGKGYYGASIMPVEVLKTLRERLPELRLWNLYGQTEIAPVATILKPGDQLRKAGSAGKPVLHVETRVVDDAGEDVAPGLVGEVVHRSPQLLSEYFNNPEKTAEAFAGGWFHSGDLATLDDEGYLTIVDRKKDIIKSGGENVSGREVEEVIYQHPAVAEVAVIGLPHPTWVEAVVAVVVARPDSGADAAAIIEHCRHQLAGFKVPKKVIFAPDLPRNPSGKILKRDLRDSHREAFGGSA